MGRQSTYTPELAAAICERLSQGETLLSICRDEAMPGLTTVKRWLLANDEFRTLYARAREEQADTLAEQALDVADNSTGDWARDRLRVDTRKWFASKMRPRVYGERQTVEHEGSVNHFVMQVPTSAGTIDEWLKQSSSGVLDPARSTSS